MSRSIKTLIKILPLTITFILGVVLRFYKLNWGNNFFFHPDEYHISAAVERISFPINLNPHLFSYGSFTVYLIYFTRLFLDSINKTFQNISPFIIGRFYSALFSSLTIINFYLIAKRVFKNKVGLLLTTFLIAITPGLIQQAHFSTPEATITFWISLSCYLWLKWLDENKINALYLSAISLGIATATKITAAVILPVLLILPLIKPPKLHLGKIVISLKLFVIWFLTHFLFFPYSILDLQGFVNSLRYESAVAGGILPVFYTRQFVGTQPVIFQVTKILPYSLGIVLLIFGLIGIILIFFTLVLNLFKRRRFDMKLLVIFLVFLLIFFPNSFLYAKWTRFINPTFPFFSIFAAYLILRVSSLIKSAGGKDSLIKFLSLLIATPTFIWAIMFISIYKQKDVRISASDWINNNIPKESLILTETGNTLEVPLWGGYKKIAFDFYNLDDNPNLQKQLLMYISSSDYFIIQSRRIFMNELSLVNQFPITSKFYNLLFSGKLGYEKIAEFNSFPQLKINDLNFVINDESGEETWSVFDHPVIRIYKKVNFYPIEYYAQTLKI